MPRWFLDNYKWVFDGIGILCLTSILKFAWSRRSSTDDADQPAVTANVNAGAKSAIIVGNNNTQNVHNHHTLPVSTAIEKQTSPDITPEKLKADLKRATPYNRKSVASSFEGLVVQWQLELPQF